MVEAAGNLRGSERALLDLLGGTAALTPAVCCPPERPLNAELEKRGIRVFPYFVYELHRKSKWYRGLAALGVLRACFEFNPDVIYLNQSGAYKAALPAAAVLGVPMVGHVRLFEDPGYLAQQKPDSRRLRGLVAVSSAVLDEIRRFPELSAIPHHLVYDAYARRGGVHENAAARKNRQCIACVGQLESDKGTDILVGALMLLQQHGKNVTCAFVGEGEDNFVDELKRTAVEGGASSAMEWLGFVPNVPEFLRRYAVLACPSHRETLGRVILEAWDAGAVPVVFSGSGGAAEIVAAAHGGILYDQQTPKSLAKGLQAALELDPEQAAVLIANGRSWMARNCAQKASSEAIAKIFSTLAEERADK